MTDIPPPDAPIPGDAPGEVPSGAGAEPSDPKRRLIIGAAALAVLVSAIVTFAVVANNNDSDNASAKTTTSSRPTNGQSSTSGTQTTASGGTTTTGSGVTSSTVPGSTGPQPTDAITKLPIDTSATTSSTPNGVTTTPTTGNGPSDDQLDAAYLEAYLAECTKIWGHSSNGLLYDPDDPQDSYTITTCTESADAAFRTSSNTIAAAKKLGVEDAIWFSSLNTSSGQMCWLDTANDTLLACWDPENPDVPTTPTTS